MSRTRGKEPFYGYSGFWEVSVECYGIVKMEKVGSWANELFLVGTWHNGDAAVNFEYDIKSRGLTLYRHKPEEGTV